MQCGWLVSPGLEYLSHAVGSKACVEENEGEEKHNEMEQRVRITTQT